MFIQQRKLFLSPQIQQWIGSKNRINHFENWNDLARIQARWEKVDFFSQTKQKNAVNFMLVYFFHLCVVAFRVRFIRVTHIDYLGPIVFFLSLRATIRMPLFLWFVLALSFAPANDICGRCKWMRSTFLCGTRVCVRVVRVCVCGSCFCLVLVAVVGIF